MITVGLTGSIGMGKSTASQMFAELGAAVWSADAAVHRLYGKDGAALGAIEKLFPGVVGEDGVDRTALAKIVLSDPEKLRALEAVVHPLVGKDRAEFIQAAAHAGAPMVVLDIPLLFENASDEYFDFIVVVSAQASVQRERVLARPGMSEEKLDAILAQQMPDAEKRERADFVVSTDRSLDETRAEIEQIFNSLAGRSSSDSSEN
ncbi:MAG: dephospho-CoA kinase [Marinicaulis sp.]|nr:dephospho-CoA kinase [Marinicaulis sp.]